MFFPITIVDDFLKNPDELVSFSKTVKMDKSNDVPGYRSDKLSEINYEMYTYVAKKMLSILYPQEVNNVYNNIEYHADAYFQSTKTNEVKDGWIHADENYLTTILYLSEDYDYGTSFYKKKTDYATGDTICKDSYEGKKKKFFSGENTDLDDLKKTRLRNNLDFKKTVEIKGLYNRLIMFDPNYYHAVDVSPKPDENTDRLILMYFFWDMRMKDNRLKLPISESRTF